MPRPIPTEPPDQLPKRVLIVTFKYPPAAAATPSPIHEWVKYLPEFGWKPFVLTAATETASKPLSPDPTNTVFRVPHRQSFKKIVQFRSKYPHNRLSFKLINYFLINWLFYPDDKRGWFNSAFDHGQRIIENEKIDLIIGSGAPWTAFWVANRLSRKMAIPWVAHYEDPWTQSTSQGVRPQWIFHAAASRVMERKLIDSARFCLHASDRWADQLHRMSGKAVLWIPNGYDSKHFRGADKTNPSTSKFTLSYVGTLHFPQKLDPFLEGFARFIAAEKIGPEACTLNFIGTSELNWSEEKYPSLAGFIRMLPYMEKERAIRYMLKSHILLLFSNDDDGWYPSKLYDYLASNRLILSSPDSGGVVNHLLKQTGAGLVLHQPDEIAMWLSACMRKFRLRQDMKKPNNPNDIGKFERRRLTEKVSNILSHIPLSGSQRHNDKNSLDLKDKSDQSAWI